MRNTSLAHHIVPGFVLYIKRHSSSSDRKRIVRRRLSITPDCRKTLVFSRKSQETCLQGSPPVHGRRPQCSNRQCKSPPSNLNMLSEGRMSASANSDSSISIKPRFATIPSPVIRYLINDFGKIVGYLTLSPQANALVANLLTLNPTLIKVKRHLPSASFYESHRRQPSITRFARLNKQRSGDLSLFLSAPKS